MDESESSISEYRIERMIKRQVLDLYFIGFIECWHVRLPHMNANRSILCVTSVHRTSASNGHSKHS